MSIPYIRLLSCALSIGAISFTHHTIPGGAISTNKSSHSTPQEPSDETIRAHRHLRSAAQTGNVTHIMALLERSDIDINVHGSFNKTPLILAAQKGHKDCVTLLIAAGADLNRQEYQGHTALMEAVRLGHITTAHTLIGAGADLDISNSRGETALYFAANRGDREIVCALLDAGANVNANMVLYGVSALSGAICGDHHLIVDILIRAGAEIDFADSADNTLLMLAATRNSPLILSALIQEKATINRTNHHGSTALMNAVCHGNLAAVILLIEAGADKHVQLLSSGKTLLMLAMERDHQSIVEFLITAGTDVNIPNLSGNTLLMEAVHKYTDTQTDSRYHKTIDLLLKRHDKVECEKALHMAQEKGLTLLVKLIENYLDEHAPYSMVKPAV